MESYLAAPAPKALAMTRSGPQSRLVGRRQGPRDHAAEECCRLRAKHSEPCTVVLENFDIVPEGAQGSNQ